MISAPAGESLVPDMGCSSESWQALIDHSKIGEKAVRGKL